MHEKFHKYFLEIYKNQERKFKTFPHHVDIVIHWVDRLCDLYPEAERDVAKTAAIFHDIGHFWDQTERDHAIVSEEAVRKYLAGEGCAPAFIDRVAHAVRSHRNADIKPQTLEAKILVFSDSASHLTAPDVYLYVAAGIDGQEGALAKLERDYRDLDLFPNEKKELHELYLAWRNVLESFPQDFYPFIREKSSAKKHNK